MITITHVPEVDVYSSSHQQPKAAVAAMQVTVAHVAAAANQLTLQGSRFL
jgi:hypothetical protein